MVSPSAVCIQLSIAQSREFSLCSTLPMASPYESWTSSLVSDLRSPLVSRANQRFGGSATRTPRSRTLRLRGSTSLSRKTVFLSIRPSPSVSSSTLTRPVGSFSVVAGMSSMYPGISTTQSRPSRSQSMATGSSIMGSLATSSSR